jgi:predicted Zn-dependent peptidase
MLSRLDLAAQVFFGGSMSRVRALAVIGALVVLGGFAIVDRAAAQGSKGRPVTTTKPRPKSRISALPTARATTATVSPSITLPVQRHVLENGLVVLLHEDHSVPAVTFWQWFKVGSRDERPGITGISHFFEHMMFNGSKNVAPKEYDRIIESAGGASNAFTDRDMTAYYEDIASDQLDVLFRLDADRMADPLFDPQVMKSEIEVVKEERRLRVDDDIAGLLDEQLYATAFNASPYRWPVIGWMKDLERLTREECLEYFRTYYAPNNCILVLTGDFDSKAALAAIEKSFGGIASQPPPPDPINSEPEQRGERRVFVHYPAEAVSFQLGYKAPGVESPDVYVLDVLSSILSQGESSRLHQALVYEKQIALDAGTFFRTRLDSTLFEFSVEMKPGKTAAEGEAALHEVVDKLAREGPTERELQKAKNQLEASFIRSLKTNNGVGEQLAFHEHVFGGYRAMFDVIDRYRRVTAADCRRVAQRVFVPTQRTVSILVPQKEGGAPAAP